MDPMFPGPGLENSERSALPRENPFDTSAEALQQRSPGRLKNRQLGCLIQCVYGADESGTARR